MRRLRYILVVLIIAGASLHGNASTGTLSKSPPVSQLLPGGGWQFTPNTTFSNPAPQRSWANGPYGAAPKGYAKDIVTLGGRGGAMLVTVGTGAGMSALGAAVARCVLLANPVCAGGTAAWLIYDTYRVRNSNDVPGSTVGTGLLDYDSGQDAVMADGWTAYDSDAEASGNGSTIASTLAALVDNCAKPVSAYGYQLNQTCATRGGAQACTPGNNWNGIGYDQRCVLVVYKDGFDGARPVHFEQDRAILLSPGRVKGCPASIDAFDPKYNIPQGSPVGRDGKCPTARGNHIGITPDQAGDLWGKSPPESGTYDPKTGQQTGGPASRAVSDAIDKGGQTAPGAIEAPAPGGVTGPASQTGNPSTTTTTGPTGTTTTVSNPTYNYTYNGDTINVSNTTVTTTTAPDGSQTTETKTGALPATPGEPVPPEDPCSANPDRVGCMKAGSLEPVPVAKKVIPVSIDRDTGWGEGVGSCPAGKKLELGGMEFEFKLTQMCDFAVGIRPVVLGMAWLSAAVGFIGLSRRD